MGNSNSSSVDHRSTSASRAFTQKKLDDLKSLFSYLDSKSQSVLSYLNLNVSASLKDCCVEISEFIYQSLCNNGKGVFTRYQSWQLRIDGCSVNVTLSSGLILKSVFSTESSDAESSDYKEMVDVLLNATTSSKSDDVRPEYQVPHLLYEDSVGSDRLLLKEGIRLAYWRGSSSPRACRVEAAVSLFLTKTSIIQPGVIECWGIVQASNEQDTKHNTMKGTVSRLDQTPFVHKVSRKGFKITVPKEPNLKTAQRAARNRFKAQSAPEQIAKFSSTVNKAVQETSSASLPKKNTPRPQDFQTFHLRTSLRERERSSSAKIAPTDNSKHSLTLVHKPFINPIYNVKSVGSKNGRKVKASRSSKSNCQTSSKCGEAIDIKDENNLLRVFSSLKEFEAPMDTNFRDEPFIESLRKLCLTSDNDSVAVFIDLLLLLLSCTSST
ncbi:hypothetical protein ARALYDRAFT_349983 [Arabidopsis lyrata subsp. lyrata]|uniref:TPX2 central domain-containing protein n=1 Tax=Arabidopsis lyrata subsp. lyrata TaxID=81972 RepID=D7M0G3_ARALL|nr:hypothetical protein ARALYDRAFT_349983 [Arabidopsis lyrata subsp. lyrata]